jgi:hypothetical protein
MKFIFLMAFSLAMTLAAGPKIEVFKTSTCGCCKKWIAHLEAAGFQVVSTDVPETASVSTKLGVPEKLRSCHVGKVNGYTVEGHVPAKDILEMVKRKPKIVGIAVPGMPMGSPGMEGPVQQPYQVIAFDKAGNLAAFATYK